MRQIKLDLNFDQRPEPLQYKLNLPDINVVNDNKNLDFMVRRYQQLVNLTAPILTAPSARPTERTDLRYLEAGSKYYEIQDFYTKFNILKSVTVPADDVLLVQSEPQAKSISRWSNYTVCVNWYIQNWGTIYQYYDQEQMIDQFRPEDFTLWAIDLEQAFQTINLDYESNTRIYISWLYKNRTLNQILADWTRPTK